MHLVFYDHKHDQLWQRPVAVKFKNTNNTIHTGLQTVNFSIKHFPFLFYLQVQPFNILIAENAQGIVHSSRSSYRNHHRYHYTHTHTHPHKHSYSGLLLHFSQSFANKDARPAAIWLLHLFIAGFCLRQSLLMRCSYCLRLGHKGTQLRIIPRHTI